MRINPPLYIASTRIECWKCGAHMPAITLVAPDIPDSFGDVGVLSNIQTLPPEITGFVGRHFPHFKLSYSKTTQSRYFANTCPKCKMISGDFYLHSEPGATFCPETPDDARCLWLKEIPVASPVDIGASPGVGSGELILEHGRR